MGRIVEAAKAAHQWLVNDIANDRAEVQLKFDQDPLTDQNVRSTAKDPEITGFAKEWAMWIELGAAAGLYVALSKSKLLRSAATVAVAGGLLIEGKDVLRQMGNLLGHQYPPVGSHDSDQLRFPASQTDTPNRLAKWLEWWP